jgi:hypothetical protein
VTSYVITLASKTGWDENYILWELPLSRGFQYQHAIWRLHGVEAEWGVSKAKRLDDMARVMEIK